MRKYLPGVALVVVLMLLWWGSMPVVQAQTPTRTPWAYTPVPTKTGIYPTITQTSAYPTVQGTLVCPAQALRTPGAYLEPTYLASCGECFRVTATFSAVDLTMVPVRGTMTQMARTAQAAGTQAVQLLTGTPDPNATPQGTIYPTVTMTPVPAGDVLHWEALPELLSNSSWRYVDMFSPSYSSTLLCGKPESIVGGTFAMVSVQESQLTVSQSWVGGGSHSESCTRGYPPGETTCVGGWQDFHAWPGLGITDADYLAMFTGHPVNGSWDDGGWNLAGKGADSVAYNLRNNYNWTGDGLTSYVSRLEVLCYSPDVPVLPTATPTATPMAGDCSAPRYTDQKPAVSIDSFSLTKRECYNIIPGIEQGLPFTDAKISLPQVDACVGYFTFPKVELFGFVVPFSIFAIIPCAFLIRKIFLL